MAALRDKATTRKHVLLASTLWFPLRGVMGFAISDFISNPWVVTIAGGIPTGLLVFFITQRIFTKRDDTEYRQHATSANREVIYALRPGISEGVVPQSNVLDALIRSTARKYEVEVKDVYDRAKIGEELTKEVMDSSFISARQKAEFCAALESLSAAPPLETPQLPSSPTRRTSGITGSAATAVASMLGILAASVGALYSLSERPTTAPGSPTTDLVFRTVAQFLVPGALTVGVAASTLILDYFWRRFRRDGFPRPDAIGRSESGHPGGNTDS